MMKKKDTPAVFIDANVFLDALKGPSKKTIAELTALIKLLEAGKCVLYKTEQLLLEFSRNDKEEISKPLVDITLSSDDYISESDRKNVEALLEGINKKRQEAHKSQLKEVRSLIDTSLDNAVLLKTQDDLVHKAFLRSLRGSPPLPKKDNEIGKRCLGDGIHWIALLQGVEQQNLLILVTRDSDFSHEFLAEEWKRDKGGGLTVQSDLKSLLTYLKTGEVTKKPVKKSLSYSVVPFLVPTGLDSLSLVGNRLVNTIGPIGSASALDVGTMPTFTVGSLYDGMTVATGLLGSSLLGEAGSPYDPTVLVVPQKKDKL